MVKKVIHWFRQDLRLSDNPAFLAACEAGDVLPVYILDDVNSGEASMGAASRVWLHHSLESLQKSLQGNLQVFAGNPQIILENLIKTHKIDAVHWNRCYEPWRIQRDKHLKEWLQESGVEVGSFNGSLLWEPWEVLKKDDTPYKVFTPFYRRGCLAAAPPHDPLPAPSTMSFIKTDEENSPITSLKLLPEISWDRSIIEYWHFGEDAAQEKLDIFLNNGLSDYKDGRNFPAQKNVSQLSPYLHFGEISPNQIWTAARQSGSDRNVDHFCSELGWREFSHNLLYFNPELPEQNLQSKFDNFQWRYSDDDLKAWQQGQTGYPIVDAGMRELWQTGYMHNRVRMIVGSFLVKNLLLDWRLGERWFWDCLVDADMANNSAGWQWIAGCGADAAPYFRIFNPVTQGQKFDKTGDYTRKYVPELKNMPEKYLFNPWEAPQAVLEQAGVVLGENYPQPVIDIKQSRERALNAFQDLKVGEFVER